MHELVVLPVAVADLEAALDWYEQRSRQAMARFAQETETALAETAQSPHRFPAWDEQHQYYLLRRFPYYVAYRLRSGRVEIVAIRHAARQ